MVFVGHAFWALHAIVSTPRNEFLMCFCYGGHRISSLQAFDDETKQIRNDSNRLLRKIHTRVDRAHSCLPLSTYTAKWVWSEQDSNRYIHWTFSVGTLFDLFPLGRQTIIWNYLHRNWIKMIVNHFPDRYERRHGPDSFVAHLASPLKSTTYNGLDSYDPNKYIGMYMSW